MTAAKAETVGFALADVNAGQLDELCIATGFLAVLALVCGREPIRAEPVLEQIRDWSDYDYPKEEDRYIWGDEAYGLQAIGSAQFVRHGVKAGAQVFWVFKGLPEGLKVLGQSKLHSRWHSYARLTLEGLGPERAEAACRAFREALAPWDAHRLPDGRAIELLEETLTDLCWYSRALTEVPLAALQEAEEITGDTPVGASLSYLLAVLFLAHGTLDEAADRLAALEARGEALTFSHGMNLGRNAEGLPEQLVWQDAFEPPAPYYEVLLGLGDLARRRGESEQARKYYQRVRKAKQIISAEQARALLELMKKPDRT